MVNKLRFSENWIEILCAKGDTETYRLSSYIPYIHSNRSKTKFTTTIRNIDLVLKLFRDVDFTRVDDKLHDFLLNGPPAILKLVDKEFNRRSVTDTLLELGPDEDPDSFLWTHQQLGQQLSLVNNRFGFFYDTRTGKTPMSLQIIQDDIDRNPTHKWLVLCPLILIENAWLPDAAKMFPRLKVVNLHDKHRYQRLMGFKLSANLYVSNIESFIDYKEHFYNLKVHGCIVDESSTMKSNSSKFGIAAVEFANTCKKWYLLSGTPAPNGEWEYYRQLQSIDFYGVHESFAQFSKYFFYDISRNPQYKKLVVLPDKKEELLGLLRQYSLYVDKEDVLKTPGRDFEEAAIQLPKELVDNYRQLKEHLYIEIGDNLTITSVSKAGNLNKLNQITSGFIIDTLAMKHNKMLRQQGIKTGFKEESHILSYYRFEELQKILARFPGKQVLIWCTYRKEFEIIEQMLGADNCALIYGATSITDKNIGIKDFMSGKKQYLVANPASADKGLTLVNAHICVYFSLSYSYELWKQSKERIYGDISKQPNRCIYITMIAYIDSRGTVDGIIYDTVQNKGDMSMAVLDHLKGKV